MWLGEKVSVCHVSVLSLCVFRCVDQQTHTRFARVFCSRACLNQPI